MELVTVNNGLPVTTTLAIAEGLEVEHASIIKLVRTHQADLEEFGPCRFEIDVVKRPQGGGSEREYAELNERQATLIMTYAKNTEIARAFKKRLVKTFYELAEQVKAPAIDLNNPHTMRALLLGYTEKVVELESKVTERDKLISITAPKAAVADRLQGADGWLCLRDAAKALKMSQQKFIDWLLIKKWLYRDQKGKLRGRAEKTPQFINHKVQPIPCDGDADRVSLQPMVTAEGLTSLAKIFNVELEAQP